MKKCNCKKVFSLPEVSITETYNKEGKHKGACFPEIEISINGKVNPFLWKAEYSAFEGNENLTVKFYGVEYKWHKTLEELKKDIAFRFFSFQNIKRII